MRRLYLQIYATVVAIVVVFALLVGLTWKVFGPTRDDARRNAQGIANVIGRVLPPADAPLAQQQAAIDQLARDLDVQLTLRDAHGALLARTGAELPATRAALEAARARHHVLRLSDGRTLSAAWPHEPLGWIVGIAAFAAAIALGAYPVVRRITRRLERLRAQVEALGAGELSARVEVRGRDEIAGLAQSFNRAAERIEKLVAAQRGALASASHELRSPLARIRVAIELIDGAAGDALRARVAPDVVELDALIGELLLASRLDALAPGQALERRESVDLLGLAAEEAARTGAEVAGEAVLVDGDAHLLRRLVRNLLENARRHGGGSAVEVSVARAPGAPRAHRGRGPRAGRARGRARADLRAVLPAGRRARVARRQLRPRPRAGAPDRAPPRRRRALPAARGRRNRVRGRARRCHVTTGLPDNPGVIAKPPSLNAGRVLCWVVGSSSSGRRRSPVVGCAA